MNSSFSLSAPTVTVVPSTAIVISPTSDVIALPDAVTTIPLGAFSVPLVNVIALAPLISAVSVASTTNLSVAVTVNFAPSVVISLPEHSFASVVTNLPVISTLFIVPAPDFSNVTALPERVNVPYSVHAVLSSTTSAAK